MARKKITVVNWYDVFPFNHGGSLAIRGLYKALSEWLDISVVTFSENDIYRDRVSLSRCLEIASIPKPARLLVLEKNFYKENGFNENTLIDNALIAGRYYSGIPEFIHAIRRIAADSEILIAEHPYTYRLLEQACPDRSIWYRAQNIEYDYKKATWDKIENPEPLLSEVFDIEKECCENAELILTISEADAQGIQKYYAIPESKILNISAGYDTGAIDYTPPRQRSRPNHGYRLSTLYISSNASVAVQAAYEIISIAKDTPDILYNIVGSVGSRIDRDSLPDNVNVAGMVSDAEKIQFLKECDVALNLIEGGSGLNMKMLEYFAYGLPVITTKFGARGLDVVDGKECIFTEGSHYKEDILAFAEMDVAQRDMISERALATLKERYSWRGSALKIIDKTAQIHPSAFSDPVTAPACETELMPYEPGATWLPDGGDEPLYLWGAGMLGRKCLERLRDLGISPVKIIDTNSEKWNKKIDGVEIVSPKHYFDSDAKGTIILSFAEFFPVLINLLRRNVLLSKIAIAFNGTDLFRCDNRGILPYYVDYEKLIDVAKHIDIPDLGYPSIFSKQMREA